MSDTAVTARLAMSTEFLESFSVLEKKIQAKVRKFMTDFQQRPDSGGTNFEKIKAAPDGNLRSVRIDQNYRGILLAPENGNIFVFLWVDKHDDAYAWAAGRRVSIHPKTGAIQIIESTTVGDADAKDTVPGQAVTASPSPSPFAGSHDGPKLFDPFTDDELIALGVPAELIELARTIRDENDLNTIQRRFPPDAQEALQYLAGGYGYSEVLEALGLGEENEDVVNTDDFETALDNDLSRRSILIITSDTNLEAALDYPLDKWRVFLHPQQQRTVTVNATGPYRVLGGAGTGKTVVAMHRACHLIRSVFPDTSDRVLFTTYNPNLAADISRNLDKLCTAEERDRIEVMSIDKWARKYLKAIGRPATNISEDALAEMWSRALAHKNENLALPDTFFPHEWETVVQYQGITSATEYLTARRTGSGTRLSRKQRLLVWEVFERLRSLVSEQDGIEFADILRLARVKLKEGERYTRYVAVIIDEAQDMHPEAFRLTRAILVPPDQPIPANSIFIVGDGHQRIYRQPVKLSDCGIPIVGRSRRLRLNYRTTEETRRYAAAVLSGETIDDLDGDTDSLSGYTSLMHGVKPEEIACTTDAEQLQAITGQISAWLGPDFTAEDLSTVCVVTRTREQRDSLCHSLANAGTTAQKVEKDGEPKKPGVRVATMHRVKGIEYDYMIIAGADNESVPLRRVLNRQGATEVDRRNVIQKERSLLYVALTRARKGVMVSWVGERSELLP
jgi:mRNA-degrading endonuclease RelE of RelBE toxin-antitoxin system